MPENEKPGETTLFIQRMDGELLGWDRPAARLREALDRDQLRLHAQPVVALEKEGEDPEFAEVLVRLREDEARLLPPGDFLPAFEHYGMMAELDRWVVRHALGRLGQGGRLRKLSVNVSGQTIEDGGFAAFAAEQLRLAGLAPAALVLEIDENDAIDRRQAAERFAAAMKEVGCELTLDGFARRSVSFELLKPLRVDYVKVDGAIVRNIMRSGSAASKLKAILHAGRATGVKVIAECVEDDRILSSLKLLKVGYAQGFGIRRPEPIDELFKKLIGRAASKLHTSPQ
ncbi:MAG TPA: EAL domain-containing protein [Burkholderiales bacterium]|nr:EAL domain-containing protein [Burkholderiales bacterium]